MPSKSAKQRRFMAAAANNPKFAKKAGIDQSVAQEFHSADKNNDEPKFVEDKENRKSKRSRGSNVKRRSQTGNA